MVKCQTCWLVYIAASRLSPVSMAVLMPNDLSSLMASATPDRQASDRLNIPTKIPPQYIYPTDLPSLISPSRLGTEITVKYYILKPK